jgi:hypothetical protein
VIPLGTYEAADGAAAVRYLRQRLNMPPAQLGLELGASGARVTAVSSGTEPWPTDWTARAAALLERHQRPAEAPPETPAPTAAPEPEAVPEVSAEAPAPTIPPDFTGESRQPLNPDSNRDSTQPMALGRIELSEQGIRFPADLSEQEWDATAEFVSRAEKATQWWIADLYRAQTWGYKAAAMERIGIHPKTAERYAAVADVFPPDRRLPLSFAHHQLVYKRDDAADLLLKAGQESLSVNKLRAYIKELDGDDGEEKPETPKERADRLEQELHEQRERDAARIRDLEQQLELLDPEPPASSVQAMQQRHDDALRKLQSRLDKARARIKELEAGGTSDDSARLANQLRLTQDSAAQLARENEVLRAELRRARA